MSRTIYAVELTLWKIDLVPNGPSEGERIVNKVSVEAHYDGSRTEADAFAAYKAANEALSESSKI